MNEMQIRPGDRVSTSLANEAEWIAALTDRDLVDNAQACADTLAHYDEVIAPIREQRRAMLDALAARLVARNASVLVHPEYDVRVELPVDKNALGPELLAALTPLVDAGDVDASDVSKAVWKETPPPIIRTHMTYIKALVKKYGDLVAGIVEKNLIVTQGAPRLKVTPKERPLVDVTEEAAL